MWKFFSRMVDHIIYPPRDVIISQNVTTRQGK